MNTNAHAQRRYPHAELFVAMCGREINSSIHKQLAAKLKEAKFVILKTAYGRMPMLPHRNSHAPILSITHIHTHIHTDHTHTQYKENTIGHQILLCTISN